MQLIHERRRLERDRRQSDRRQGDRRRGNAGQIALFEDPGRVSALPVPAHPPIRDSNVPPDRAAQSLEAWRALREEEYEPQHGFMRRMLGRASGL